MKILNFLAFAGMAIYVMACNTERQAIVSAPVPSNPSQFQQAGKMNFSALSKMEKIGLVSPLSVKLETVDGTIVKHTSSLQPNTNYRIIVGGLNADHIQLRACFGFDLITQEQTEEQQKTASYLIKTHSDVLEPIFVSFIPIRNAGARQFREQAQTFQLTDQTGIKSR